jgi:hypothetical protein
MLLMYLFYLNLKKIFITKKTNSIYVEVEVEVELVLLVEEVDELDVVVVLIKIQKKFLFKIDTSIHTLLRK